MLQHKDSFETLQKNWGGKFFLPSSLQNAQSTLTSSVSFHWGTCGCSESQIDALEDFSQKSSLLTQYRALVEGHIMNTTEHRSVDHHILRAKKEDIPPHRQTLWKLFIEERERVFDCTQLIHNEQHFTTLIHMGIGGSALAPALIHQAFALQSAYMDFIPVTSIDPDMLERALQGRKIDHCLFLIVSKSGKTQETLENMRSLPSSVNFKKQVIVITTAGSCIDLPDTFKHVFYLHHGIGGRFSLTSIVGASACALLYGEKVFMDILEGARLADLQAHTLKIRDNPTLMDALFGVRYRLLNHGAIAIIPYSTALSKLPAFLQQLDMESNGKHCTRNAQEISYKTGPIIFGELGTDAQHSFFQFLHQGTDIVPVQFIGFRYPQKNHKHAKRKHNILLAHLAAQIVALAQGKSSKNKSQYFEGNRPSTLILGNRLDPHTFGALIAHYENKIMFQGFCWDINSFDQEGVQLGKKLVKELSSNHKNSLLQEYACLLGISENA